MDESVAAKCLMETCRIPDFRAFSTMQMCIRWRMQDDSCDAEKALEFMVKQWKTYQASMGRMDWRFAGAEGFFKSAIWQDESLWPWQRLVPRPDASLGVNNEGAWTEEQIEYFKQKRLPAV